MIARTLMTCGIVTALGLTVAVAQQAGQGPGEPGQRPGPQMHGGPGGPGGPGHHGPPPPPPLLIALDADKDGVISAEEIANAAAALATLDANGDGTLDRDELRPPPPPKPEDGAEGERPSPVEHLMRRDRNEDGVLTAEELLPPHAKHLFEEADTNADGALDQTELETFFESRPEPPADAPDRTGERGQRGGDRGGRPPRR